MILVGTSGYAYDHWRGVLYPEGFPKSRWLSRYAETFSTVELNATFYRFPSARAAARWRESTPPGFVFAVKGSRFLTHMKRLQAPPESLARFFAPLAELGGKLRVILWQLPPGMRPDPARLDRFLAHMPPGLRCAVEVRDPSWYSEEVCAVLDRRGAALCEHDLCQPPPRPTGGFRYLRFHGATARYAGRYGKAALAPVACDLLRWKGDVFAYFNNDVGGAAVLDALDLCALVGIRPARVASEARAETAPPAHTS